MDVDKFLKELAELPQEDWPTWLHVFIQHDDYSNYRKIVVEKQLSEVKRKLFARTFWEERIEFINTEVRKMRDILETYSSSSLLEFLNKPISKLQEEAEIFEKTKEYYLGFDFKSLSNDPILLAFIGLVFEGKEAEITQEDYVNYLKERQEEFPDLKNLIWYAGHSDPEKGHALLLIDTKMNEFLYQGLLSIQRDVINSYKTFRDNQKEVEGNGMKSSTVFNEPRQILTIYLLLKTLGLEEQFTTKTQVARLIHLLAAKDIPVNSEGKQSLDNSTLYKKLKEGFKKSDKKYVSDLEFIRQIIEPLATVGAKGINELLDTITNEINNSKE